MTLASGSKLGPYEILGQIGAGGMGEVYRAKDPRLSREVAIKVLPASFSQDADRLRRFEQEAKAAGVLNHPNITAVYDIGTSSSDGAPYVVQELLEGETLRSVLAGGRLSPRKAIDCSLQIVHGLAAAHEKGIVHRDLKPENLFVTKDGRVKILDFGLAKLTHQEEGSQATSLPTATAGTEPGVVLGTLGYMSPEQVRGKPADARSDIFAFGAILYEMLSGKRAFHGDSAADTMSAILKEDPPDLSATNQNVSPGLDRIVRHCLEKSAEQRFHSAHDIAFAFDALSGQSGVTAAPVASARARAPRWLAAAALIAGGFALGLLLAPRILARKAPEPPRLRFITSSGDDWAPSASPDGKTLAFASDRDGRRRIWLKQIDLGSEIALTDGPDDSPRFSPDGSTVLFERAEGRRHSLYRQSILGGEPRRIVSDAWGGDWSPDGVRIVYVRQLQQETDSPIRTDRGRSAAPTIMIAQADGSDPRTVADLSPLVLDSPPRWSPGGAWIAATMTQTTSTLAPQIVLISPDGKQRRVLAPLKAARVGMLAWNGSGRELVYGQPDSLDYTQLAATGSVVLQDIVSGRSRTLLELPRASLTVSILGPGRLALDTTAARQTLREIRLDAGTLSASRALTGGNTSDRQPAYAPDGDWVIFAGGREGNFDLWKVSTKTGAVRRLTSGPASEWDPAFMDRGRQIIFSSNRSGVFEIWTADAEGGGARQVSHDGIDAENPTATPDGSWIVYTAAGGRGLWKIHADGTGATRLAVGSGNHPETSPDGVWALYFDTSTRQSVLRVCHVTDGQPAPFEIVGLADARARWLPDGRSIVFRDRDENGRWALFRQDFAPGRDTLGTRKLLVSSPSESEEVETFGISPDGARLTIGVIRWESGILMADGLDGILPLRNSAR